MMMLKNQIDKIILLLCVDLETDDHHIQPLSPKLFWLIWNSLEEVDPQILITTPLDKCIEIPLKQKNRISKLMSRQAALNDLAVRLKRYNIQIITFYNHGYPTKLLNILSCRAPPVLFVHGNLDLFNTESISVTGVRKTNTVLESYAEIVGMQCAKENITLVSGCARGTDRKAMQAVLKNGGSSIGIVPDKLHQHIRNSSYASYLENGSCLLCTPYHPFAGFTAGKALGRNKLIYCLGKIGIVIAATEGKGGTWHGAVEVLENNWARIYAHSGFGCLKGNEKLLERGAFPINLASLNNTDTNYLRQLINTS